MLLAQATASQLPPRLTAITSLFVVCFLDSIDHRFAGRKHSGSGIEDGAYAISLTYDDSPAKTACPQVQPEDILFFTHNRSESD